MPNSQLYHSSGATRLTDVLNNMVVARVAYTVYYDYHKPANGKPGVVGYKVDSVKVDLVLDASAAGTTRREQTFSLKFLAKPAADGGADDKIP